MNGKISPRHLSAFRNGLWAPSLLCISLISSVLLGNAGFASSIAYTVVPLGPIQSIGDSGKAINSSGTAVFTVSTAVNLWHNGVATAVPNLFAGNGPLDINDAGDLAGANNLRGFLYRNGVTTDPTDLGSFNGGFTFAQGLNNNDVVVGESYDLVALRYRGFVWQNGSLQRLPAPGGAYAAGAESRAYSINASGAIAGSYNNQGASGVAVVWNGGVATALTTLAGYARSEGYAINGAQQVVGVSADASFVNEQAVLWNGTTPKNLGSLPGLSFTVAHAINSSAMVVGSASSSNGNSGNAFLWMNNQMIDLNNQISPTSGWHLTSAAGINDQGKIVGYGTLNGMGESFLLIPVPEPTTFSLVVISLAFPLLVRYRHCGVGRHAQ
jgi:probable HAF family extracellular repeat protein